MSKELSIIVFPLGPAVGSSPWYTYYAVVDFVYHYKNYNYKIFSHAVTVKNFLYDCLSFNVQKYCEKSTVISSIPYLTRGICYIFNSGYMGKFIHHEMDEDSFMTEALSMFGIRIPDDAGEEEKIKQDFWAAFMAHNTMIPEYKIEEFSHTLKLFSPAIPVAVTRSTKPCMATITKKLSQAGVMIISDGDGQQEPSSQDVGVSLYCVNKTSRQMELASTQAVHLAMTSTKEIPAHVSVSVIGDIVKDREGYRDVLTGEIQGRFHCGVDVKFFPMRTSKGDTLYSVAKKNGIIRIDEDCKSVTERRSCGEKIYSGFKKAMSFMFFNQFKSEQLASKNTSDEYQGVGYGYVPNGSVVRS